MYVTDTHPLIWYATGKHSQLSPKVLKAFQKTETFETLIYIPAVVFWEIAMLENLGKIKLRDNFERWSNRLIGGNNFEIVPLEISIVARSLGFNFNKDYFDKVIVASALELDVPLITKDIAVTDSKLVDIFW